MNHIITDAIDENETAKEDNKKYLKLLQFINKKEIITKLITIVRDSFNDSTMENTNKIILFCLGNLIPVEDAEEGDAEATTNMIEQQNFLNNCGATLMMMTQFSDSNLLIESEYNATLMEFAIRLLRGGNIKIQTEIYNFFLNTQQSQVFFQRIHDTLTQEADDTKHGKITGNIDTIKTILELLQL